MLKNKQIALIGVGAMGEAIVSGLVRQNVVQPDQILAAEPRHERRDYMQRHYGIGVSSDTGQVVHQGHLVILAVKPQILPNLLPLLRGAFQPEALCLSILAGIPIATFSTALEHAAIVRVMPNTPAQIGEGMSVWTATPAVNEEQRDWVRMVLSALGREQYVEDERYLDMATAMSGSGPAYIFLILEALVDAGVHLGFTRPVARQLALQTMLGSVRYAMQSDQHLAQLRNAVTSPGGTTAAGLDALVRGGIHAALSDAVWAAYHRARELGKQE